MKTNWIRCFLRAPSVSSVDLSAAVFHKALQKKKKQRFCKRSRVWISSRTEKCFRPSSDESALSARATLGDPAPSEELCGGRRSLRRQPCLNLDPFVFLCLLQKCIQWELSLASQWPPPFCCSCFCWRSPSSSTANAKAVSVLFLCLCEATHTLSLSVSLSFHPPSFCHFASPRWKWHMPGARDFIQTGLMNIHTTWQSASDRPLYAFISLLPTSACLNSFFFLYLLSVPVVHKTKWPHKWAILKQKH